MNNSLVLGIMNICMWQPQAEEIDFIFITSIDSGLLYFLLREEGMYTEKKNQDTKYIWK